MKYRKLLVTGSSGVLGSAFKSISEEYSENEFVFLSSKDCDLTNINETMSCIEKYRPNAILHLAAFSGGVSLSMKYPAKMLRDNTLMIFSILEAAKLCNVEKTIMTLSTGMYPPDAPLPLREESIHNGPPHSSNYGYSFAKRLIDPAIKAYREEYSMNIIGLIPSGIFGENDNFNFGSAPMLPSLIRRFYENRYSSDQIIVWGDGSPLREYTYSKDIANIYMWVLENYDDAQVLNIGTIEENSVKDIAYMISDTFNIDRNRIQFDSNKPGGIFRKNTDNSKFINISGFNYTPFKVGLENTINWFVEMYENHPEQIRLYDKARER